MLQELIISLKAGWAVLRMWFCDAQGSTMRLCELVCLELLPKQSESTVLPAVLADHLQQFILLLLLTPLSPDKRISSAPSV